MSHAGANVFSPLVQEESSPQVGVHESGGSKQQIALVSDTCINSRAHVEKITCPNSTIESNVADMECKQDTGIPNMALLYDVSANWDEKYLNTDLPKSVADIHKNRTPCKLFNEWRDQSNFDFGFIPLSHFIMPENVDYVAPTVRCPFKLYEMVKDSGQLNYIGCRIPVKSQLNVRVWEEMTVGY